MNDDPPAEDPQGDDPQVDVLAFLADPATHGGIVPVRIDTHAASVFLAGDRALKIKRAVRFPFLDFSTLEKRRAACAAELVANRPFAPELYAGVVAITREPDGRLALDGPGTPVEWAVKMRRFDETRTLDRLADAGAITPAIVEPLGPIVAAAHARAPVVAAAPWIAALGAYVEQNADAFAPRPDLFDRAAAAALTARSRAALDRLRPLLEARGHAGLVRRGHGDLHLGNIALIDGRPVPFDALEFDDTVASGDVLYDLAFLLMDFWERDLPWAANRVLDRWLAETGRPADLDALAALPLFLSLRAAIRAKVTAAKPAPPDRAAARDAAAQKYFRLACGLIDPPPPVLVAVGGLSGTGKSQAARRIARDLLPVPGAVVLRTDVLRKALAGVDEHTPLPAEAYTPEATARVYATLVAEAARVLAAGHSVVADAVFAREGERDAIAAVAATARVGFFGAFLEADLATREARVNGRARDASDADAAVARHQETYELGRLDGWARIDASGTPADTMAALRAALGGSAP
ncbi:AAA family ATPase [Rhodoplanes sp. SY1]|uniref:bifunctional aminoglycoside phosphotransferase/ATP-binding protein n=1 Tax=Rhodoplanes sp. SY1 TaxID=3166646 RepID=UPI0038B59A22